MSLSVSPPPMQVPAAFTKDKQSASFFNSLISTIYQLWTSEYSRGISAKVNTTDNTQTAMLRIPIDEGKTTAINAIIVARRTSGDGSDGDSAFYTMTGAYKNVGGTLTGIGSVLNDGGEDVSGWAVGLSSVGSYAVVIVQGAVDTDITWVGEINAITVGS